MQISLNSTLHPLCGARIAAAVGGVGTRFVRHLLAGMVIATLGSPAFAQTSADDNEIKALAQRLSDAYLAQDFNAADDLMPPTLVQIYASNHGKTLEEYRESQAGLYAAMKLKFRVREAKINPDAMEWREARDGSPVAVIPAKLVVEVASNTTPGLWHAVGDTNPVIAFKDQNQWSLYRATDEEMLMDLYTAFPKLVPLRLKVAPLEEIKE